MFTGERYLPELDQDSEISIYHMQRYLSLLNICKGKSVLDAACGEGYGTNILASVAKSVKGIDISNEAVEKAQVKYKSDIIDFVVGSVQKLPYETDVFDVVVSFETIEHVNSEMQIQFLDEIKRVLKKDGILIMSSPDKKNYSELPNFKNKYHIHELYREEFLNLLENRFKYVDLYYQGMLCNSYLYNEQKDIAKCNTNNSFYLREPDTTMAEFIVGVCSNMEKVEGIDSIILDAGNRYYKMDREIKMLKERLGDPNKIIEQKENYINELRDIIVERDKIIEQKENFIVEQRNSFIESNAIIEQKENFIVEQRNSLIESNAIIEQKENYICEQRNRLIESNAVIENKEREISLYEGFLKKRFIKKLYNFYIKKINGLD